MTSQELISVYTVGESTEAEIIRNFLEREGIDAEIGDSVQAGMTGLFDVDILVRAEDAETAKRLIESHKSGESKVE